MNSPFAMARNCAQLAWRALSHFNEDDGWAMASHVAMTGLMALFPFLIFCTALGAFVDLGGFPDMLVELIFENWPDSIAAPIAEQMIVVLMQPRGDLLTFGAGAALFFASNGVEALRLGLNRAYRANPKRNFIILRLQSIAYVLAAAIAVALLTFLLVLIPPLLSIMSRAFPPLAQYAATIEFWRLAISVLIVLVGLLAAHMKLAEGRRGLFQVLPGVAFTLLFWTAASIGFSWYLRVFANYVSTYAGLAGIFIALVYCYFLSVILLLGAELNAALIGRRDEASRQ